MLWSTGGLVRVLISCTKAPWETRLRDGDLSNVCYFFVQKKCLSALCPFKNVNLSALSPFGKNGCILFKERHYTSV
jgi:hypothetical protein